MCIININYALHDARIILKTKVTNIFSNINTYHLSINLLWTLYRSCSKMENNMLCIFQIIVLHITN